MPERIAADNRGLRSNILLVDDENQFRIATKKQLEVRGYKVWDVDNGRDAIKLVRRNDMEVVILDRKMPQMDGIRTLKEIKKIRPDLQVIMLTGYRDADSKPVSEEFGVFRYLQKPCGLDELVQLIEGARKEHFSALARHGIPNVRANGFWNRLVGANRRRSGLIIIGLVGLAALLSALLSRSCMHG